MNLLELISESSDFEIHEQHKLDKILVQLCQMIIAGQKSDPHRWGFVAAAVLDPTNSPVGAVNYFDKQSGLRVHAERAALDAYYARHGEIPRGSVMITTCSPCSQDHMEDRLGQSCTELINETPIRKVYAGYQDPGQNELNRKFNIEITDNDKINELCKRFAGTFL